MRQHALWVLDVALPEHVEPRHRCTVNDAVVGRPRHGHREQLVPLVLLVEDHLPADGADGADAHLGRDDDRVHVRAANGPDVGQRERAAREVGGAELALAAELLQPVELGRDFKHGLVLHILDVGHDQALRRVHRHADVVGRLVDHLGLVVGERAVEDRELEQRHRRGFDEDGHVRELDALLRSNLLELLARFASVLHRDLVLEAKVWDAPPRLVHGLDHHLLEAAHGLAPVAARRCRGAKRRGRHDRGCRCVERSGRRSGGGGGLRRMRRQLADVPQHVLLHHAAALAGALHVAQVHVVLLRDGPHGRRRKRRAIGVEVVDRRGVCRSGRGCRSGSSSSRRCGIRGRVVVEVDVDQGLTDLGDLAVLVVQLRDAAREPRRDLDRGLVALDLADLVELGDLVALLDEPLQHLDLDDALANVGQVERAHGPGRRGGVEHARARRHGTRRT
eukprot:Unigene8622_Nuclearia_a/m.26394 Unigene8622_Nuclearia_a/g.26394  ORF Unigene8622_Nuclearia_a/g.26394 Unigene8622_Nuclearia_a/m.26394 type:complete len:449 (-) Unigene8622_Nuclearia_a:35-1381(-)